jgi:hypothetical protein
MFLSQAAISFLETRLRTVHPGSWPPIHFFIEGSVRFGLVGMFLRNNQVESVNSSRYSLRSPLSLETYLCRHILTSGKCEARL